MELLGHILGDIRMIKAGSKSQKMWNWPVLVALEAKAYQRTDSYG